MKPKRFRSYSAANIDSITQLKRLSESQLREMLAVAKVLPFRTNNYVVEELIDWNNIPEDPLFQLTFPQPQMLHQSDLGRITKHLATGTGYSPEQLKREQYRIRTAMNPHPAGQLQLNVPEEQGEMLQGMQHKYDETVLFFPKQGQTCHAYCTYCFRWAQFIGNKELQMASGEVEPLIRYLDRHPEVSDLLITGGDPMFMRSNVLRRYIEPLLRHRPGNLQTIRIGTKSLSYWPYRYLSDKDSDDLISLFHEITTAGYHLSIMAHFTHIRELSTKAVEAAIRRIRGTGAIIRCQSPIVRHINDDASMWAQMWRREVQLGMVPYYMFIARDTGPKAYFDIPIAETFKLFSDAYRQVSGLARTVRGPSMSAKPGKILVDGITEIEGKKYFVLKMIQGREAAWVNKVFYARYDPKASWITELKPAFGERCFFFEPNGRGPQMPLKQLRNAAMEAIPEAAISIHRS
ncbi:KamA family radical SAM protein [Sediminispirochaeta bajacaliforniensis]|uniref:KamA family radical SAM protein n=1 Tax=Sediminispirochaeta bajacaliforniensis TaxID=148 RepID=UPI000377EF68|nr:lysine 2,3-aminomutase [Sediminispirochaeta bajacaliforniensis]